MSERRAYDTANINKLLKLHCNMLVPWSHIMTTCLTGKRPQLFVKLKSVSDFIDGFQLTAPDSMTGP